MAENRPHSGNGILNGIDGDDRRRGPNRRSSSPSPVNTNNGNDLTNGSSGMDGSNGTNGGWGTNGDDQATNGYASSGTEENEEVPPDGESSGSQEADRMPATPRLEFRRPVFEHAPLWRDPTVASGRGTAAQSAQRDSAPEGESVNGMTNGDIGNNGQNGANQSDDESREMASRQ